METPTQRNANRMHQNWTNSLNRAFPQAPADEITDIANREARIALRRRPTTTIDIAAGTRDRASQSSLRCKEEIKAITAHSGVRAERGCPLNQ